MQARHLAATVLHVAGKAVHTSAHPIEFGPERVEPPQDEGRSLGGSAGIPRVRGGAFLVNLHRERCTSSDQEPIYPTSARSTTECSRAGRKPTRDAHAPPPAGLAPPPARASDRCPSTRRRNGVICLSSAPTARRVRTAAAGRRVVRCVAPEQRFTAMIEASPSRPGTSAFVALPFSPDAVWGTRNRHHVAGTVGGYRVRGPIDAFGGRAVFMLGPAWLRDNAVAVGGEVEVALAPEGPQSDQLSPDIAAALSAEPAAKAFFDGLPTFYRKNFIRDIEAAKRPETRAARIAQMVSLLKEGRRDKQGR